MTDIWIMMIEDLWYIYIDTVCIYIRIHGLYVCHISYLYALSVSLFLSLNLSTGGTAAALWLQGLWDDDRGCPKRPGDGAGVCWPRGDVEPTILHREKTRLFSGKRRIYIYIYLNEKTSFRVRRSPDFFSVQRKLQGEHWHDVGLMKLRV